jgi:Ca-activated chloride channel family protein
MRHLSPFFLNAAVLCGTLAAQVPFRGTTDVVHVPVVVTGRDHALVRGLQRDDFQVLEEGKPQSIAFFSEGAPGDARPLHLGLLLDTSESMARDLGDAVNAAVQFIDALNEAVDVTFVDFDSSVRVGRFSPASYPQLFERMRASKAAGMTALYDALGVYLAQAADRDGQHVLILYTDGGDSTSSMNFGKLDELLRLDTNVLVYAIGYLENQRSVDRVAQQMRISQIARDTGGDAYFPVSANQIHEIYAKILDELLSRYTLGYVPLNRTADGRFRKLEVKVTRPDAKGVKVRTRPGYYAPRNR